ncbi:DUF6376 family protein [Ornithinibacillus xuwenensis]|uniref:DUF6376 family protein n=1 Tax=Ornithinibacillus xuwenensis TaxID=3144668 RepID=A0ABU9XLV8_9BACI
MKKTIRVFLVTTIIFLSGCALFEETQNTINYANEATEYFNKLSTFADETASLANGEVNTEALEEKLTSLEQTITEFNHIEVPELAEGIHQDILTNNEILLEKINNLQEDGQLAIEELQNAEIFQTIDSITSFMDQIEQLGLE